MYLDRNELVELGIPFSNHHLLNLERKGEFPPRRYLTPKKVAWVKSEIESWLLERSKHGLAEWKAESGHLIRPATKARLAKCDKSAKILNRNVYGDSSESRNED